MENLREKLKQISTPDMLRRHLSNAGISDPEDLLRALGTEGASMIGVIYQQSMALATTLKTLETSTQLSLDLVEEFPELEPEEDVMPGVKWRNAAESMVAQIGTSIDLVEKILSCIDAPPIPKEGMN